MAVRSKRPIMMIGLASVMLALQAAEASAQIEMGWYSIYSISLDHVQESTAAAAHEDHHNVGNGVQVGRIFVPRRPLGASAYIEEWSFFEGQTSDAFSPDSIVEIVPIQSNDAPPPAGSAASHQVTHLELSADEYDVENDDQGMPLYQRVRLSEARSCHVKEIWQYTTRGDDSGQHDRKLVGIIRQTVDIDGIISEQEWLLSADYAYPSFANGVIMQLRPSSISCSADAPGGMSFVRTIHVQVSSGRTVPERDHLRNDLTPTEGPPAFTCAMKPHQLASASAWALLLLYHVAMIGFLARYRARNR